MGQGVSKTDLRTPEQHRLRVGFIVRASQSFGPSQVQLLDFIIAGIANGDIQIDIKHKEYMSAMREDFDILAKKVATMKARIVVRQQQEAARCEQVQGQR